MISANGGLPAHRYTPQVTPRWPRGSKPASPPLVVLVGGMVAVGRSRAPPPCCFFCLRGGGLPVPPSAFPGLALALVGILCGFPVYCWWLRFARPCPGPMGRVGYVHLGLDAPYCRVRSWLCRVGGCAGGFVWPWG